MASGKANYLSDALLDLLSGNTSYSVPGTLYLALYTSAPTSAGGGTEVSGNNYARASVTNNTTNWASASSQTKHNALPIVFPQASGGNWGTVVAFGIFDASSSGHLLYW